MSGAAETGGTEMLLASDPAAVARAAALLQAGDLVAFPTDTVYGVGVPFSDAAAVQRIYLAKGRPETKGIPILLASLADLPLVASRVNEGVDGLMETFWPGPLTLILPKSPAVPPAVTQTASVAVRIPDHTLTRALIRRVGIPLAVTSANRSGEPATTDPAVVHRSLAGRIAAVLDGGTAPGGMPSTIVDCTVVPPRILRPGPIAPGVILKCYHDYRD
jgi:L-threonylcarbamoyladenylate synthase